MKATLENKPMAASMTTTTRILAVIDPTAKEQPALQRAAWYAKHADARLELFICDYDQYLAGERFFDSGSLEKARKSLIRAHLRELENHAKTLAEQGLTVDVDARWDHPLHEGIVRKAVESKADLVFKDTHYHAALKRSVFSNTDWNLIRSCPVPLWLVKPQPAAERPCIVAAIDPLHEHDKPAELDNRILDTAEELRGRLNGELHVFHAYDVAPALALTVDSMSMPISLPAREITASVRKRHTEAVHALTDEHKLDRDSVHVHEGPARQLLVELTDKLGADLVVIGAVSRSAVNRLFLGSTAEQVLDRLHCDVLVVRPADADGNE